MNFAHIGAHTKLPSRSRFVDPDRIWLGDYVFMEENVGFDTANQIFNEEPDRIRIRIGDRVTIGRHVLISAANHVEIGNNVLLAQSVYIADNDHHYTDIGVPIRDQYFSGYDGYVRVEDDCWLGRNAVIIGASRGVTIGRGSVVGANAVVTFNVPSYTLVAGNPGQVVKMYDPSEDDWARVRDDADLQRILATRERLGVQPRPVRVDLARFHHLLPPLPIDGASGLVFGLLVDSAWQDWLDAYLRAFDQAAPVTLVIGVLSTSDFQSVIDYSTRAMPDVGPTVVLQTLNEEELPGFLRAISALLVSSSELQTLQALACGRAVVGPAEGRVARWLRDSCTGLSGPDREELLKRAVQQADTLDQLGIAGRKLLERTFGVPHVPAGQQMFLYTPPSDRLGT